MKPTAECRKAIKRMNKKNNKYFQARAAAQREGVHKAHRLYPVVPALAW